MFAHSPGIPYIPEVCEDFLDLFPHRHSFLWADHPKHPTDRPEWQSEDRHPLSDRLLLQGAKLYGVRFGKVTHYLMLDIDASSRYHPYQDPFAIARIVAALEPLGLNHYVPVTSSYSGGIHLYFPFVQGQASWKIANAAAALLECGGYRLAGGQLELFPNARRYSEFCSDFNGHRVPLQAGSYLLDEEFNPVYPDRQRFVNHWRFAQNQNSPEEATLDRILKQYDRRRWQFLKHKARKFLDDLNAEIEPGWSGPGQTNYLIGRIALREYVFHHVLYGGSPLQGIDLQLRILQVAKDLPGFREFCGHQSDLIQRVTEWAKCVEHSPRYYPYGGKLAAAKPIAPIEPTWNEQRALNARDRIQAAVKELAALGELPQGTRERFLALKQRGIGSDTLYRNKDLWYGPIEPEPASDGVFLTTGEDSEEPRSPEPAPDGVFLTTAPISFYARPDSTPQESESGKHTEIAGGSGGLSTASGPLNGVEHVRAALESIRRRQQQAPPLAEPPPDEIWFQRELLRWRDDML